MKKIYQSKLTSASDALAGIRKGGRVFIGSGCGEPQYLEEELVRHADRLFDVEIIQVLSAKRHEYSSARLAEHFQVKNFFVVGRGAREAVWEGRAEFVPMFISRVPRLFNEGLIELDCALVQVSPPNNHGYMSLGVAVDVAKEAVAAADLVIAQVNPAMPVTLGDSFIHVTDVDAVVEHHEPLVEMTPPDLAQRDFTVGHNVARLVEDGSTIHVGIGHLPTAALMAMKDKTDLGVHTDMLTDAYMDLIEAKVITNRRKENYPNRIVASYCLGTRQLFDFVHMNPFVEFYPVSKTNDPSLIGAHENMVSVHEAMEVDLTGLVCASMRGNRVFSGVGGMVDFMRGTYRSARGKFVIAIHATDPGEEESHIVPVLPQGSGILASRAAAQWVVTEFGGVNLQAKSLHERAVALIEIAHPKFREELYNRARIEGLLSKGDPISLFKPVVYPQELEKRGNVEGEAFLFRPAKAQDLRAIQEFFYGLQDQDVHYRFLRTMKAFPRQEMAKMANIDYHNRMTLLVLQGEMGFERVVAIGRYRALEDSDRVEVDVVVAEEYRQKGVARRLMNYLFEIAKGKGFGGVRAYVAHDNPKTMKFIKTMGYKAKAVLNMGVWEVDIPFDQPTEEPYLEIVYPGQNDQG